jgi:hypothetical protein
MLLVNIMSRMRARFDIWRIAMGKTQAGGVSRFRENRPEKMEDLAKLMVLPAAILGYAR